MYGELDLEGLCWDCDAVSHVTPHPNEARAALWTLIRKTLEQAPLR